MKVFFVTSPLHCLEVKALILHLNLKNKDIHIILLREFEIYFKEYNKTFFFSFGSNVNRLIKLKYIFFNYTLKVPNFLFDEIYIPNDLNIFYSNYNEKNKI